MKNAVIGIGLLTATAIIGCGGAQVEDPSNGAETIEPPDAHQAQANAIPDDQWLQIPDDISHTAAQIPNIVDSVCRSIDEDGSSLVHVMNYRANDHYIEGRYETGQIIEEGDLQDRDSFTCVANARYAENPETIVQAAHDDATRVYWEVSSIRQSQPGYKGTVFTFGLHMWIDDSSERSGARFQCKVTVNAAGDASTVTASSIISDDEYDTLYYERMCWLRHQINQPFYVIQHEYPPASMPPYQQRIQMYQVNRPSGISPRSGLRI